MRNIFIILVILFSNNLSATDTEETAIGTITGYFTGWAKDQVRVIIEGTDYSEGNCPTQDGYMTLESDDTGYKTHISALLSAFMSGKQVKLYVNGCINNRPRIWAVYIYP